MKILAFYDHSEESLNCLKFYMENYHNCNDQLIIYHAVPPLKLSLQENEKMADENMVQKMLDANHEKVKNHDKLLFEYLKVQFGFGGLWLNSKIFERIIYNFYFE